MVAPHSTNTPNDFKTAALAYARAGYPVFPLAHQKKVPAISKAKGGKGFKDANTDLARIDRYWSKHPSHNIGIWIPFGIAVIDVDPRDGGDKTLDKLIDQLGLLPTGNPITETANGGRHYWFAYDGAELIYADSKAWPGIQIKTHHNGYVVVPPSTLKGGLQYRWETSILEVPL
jgi:Bifunctional DNA primase/polymerase, N-terminal